MKRAVGRLLLVLFGVVCGVLLAEVVARIVAPAPAAELLGEPTRDATPGLYLTHRTLGHTPKPGYDHAWPGPHGSIRVRVTDDGYRAPEARADLPRWVVVGDSYTMGVQVDEDETFSALLGERQGWSVVNGGVDGYSTWQALGRYEQLDDVVDAEGVVYVLFEGNDLSDNEIFVGRMRAEQGPDGRLRFPPDNGHFTPEPLVPWRAPTLFDHLRSRSLLVAAIHVMRHQPEVVASGTLARYQSETRGMTRQGRPDRERMLAALRPALQALRSAAAARGDRLLVALAPAPWMLDAEKADATLVALGHPPGQADVEGFHRSILDEVVAAGLQPCDLVPALRASEDAGEKPFLRYDGHWSRQGHRVVAETLAGCLQGGGAPGDQP